MHQTVVLRLMLGICLIKALLKEGTFLKPQTFQSYFNCILSSWEENQKETAI